jgi:hypothetical protein
MDELDPSICTVIFKLFSVFTACLRLSLEIEKGWREIIVVLIVVLTSKNQRHIGV